MADVTTILIDITPGASGRDATFFAQRLALMYNQLLTNLGSQDRDVSIHHDANILVFATGLTPGWDYDWTAEVGWHRLIQRSPFDAQARRQTSFAGVEVRINSVKVSGFMDAFAQTRTYCTHPYFRVVSDCGGNFVDGDEAVDRVFAGDVALLTQLNTYED